MAAKTRERQAPDRNGDLAGQYRKIGITAVAAAVAYQGARSNPARRPDEAERPGSPRKAASDPKRGGRKTE
jgi:hypothetical protein